MIEAKSLTMYYGSVRALDSVSFKTQKGEILGLLGPNGAGKTTLMRILTSYFYPTGGTAIIGGHDITRSPLAARKLIGYMPETAPLYYDMIVEEYVRFVAQARGLTGGDLKKRIAWVRDATGIKSIWRHSLSEVSKGYRQRVGLAQALIHDPAILILDEVTSGLDPLQIIGIRDLIHELAERKAVIFSTHILQEVEALTDHVVILNEGQVIADGTRSELIGTATQGSCVRVTLKGDRADIEKTLKSAGIADAVDFQGASGGCATFRLRAPAARPLAAELFAFVKKQGWELEGLTREEATLEESFIWFLNRGKQT